MLPPPLGLGRAARFLYRETIAEFLQRFGLVGLAVGVRPGTGTGKPDAEALLTAARKQCGDGSPRRDPCDYSSKYITKKHAELVLEARRPSLALGSQWAARAVEGSCVP